MTSAADRMRRYRARQRAGRRCLRIEVDEIALAEALAATNPPLLRPDQMDKAGALEAAVEHAIRLWTEPSDA